MRYAIPMFSALQSMQDMKRADCRFSAIPRLPAGPCKDLLQFWREGGAGIGVRLTFSRQEEQPCSDMFKRRSPIDQGSRCTPFSQDTEQEMLSPGIVVIERERFFFRQVKDALPLLSIGRDWLIHLRETPFLYCFTPFMLNCTLPRC